MKSVISLPSNNPNEKISENVFSEASTLFSQHGALQINNALSPALLKKIAVSFHTQYLEAGEHSLKKKSSQVDKSRYLTPINISGSFNNAALYAPSKILPLLQTLLGPGFVLHAFGAITAYPNSPAQRLHIDHPRLFPESNALDAFFPPYALHLSIPLLDLNEETGTTAIWEGSHRKNIADPKEMEEDKEYPLKGASFPYTKLGDCLLTDFRVYHRGMHNKSALIRPFLYMVFCRSWFNDNTNYPKQKRLKITSNELKKVPKKHIGLFSQHKSGL